MSSPVKVISAYMVRATTIRTSGPEGKAVSIDEYIDNESRQMSIKELSDLICRSDRIREKLLEPDAAAHRDLVANAELLLAKVETWLTQATSANPPRSIIEAGIGLQYLLKGMDLIPDSVPEVGYVDDARILARVVARNPELTTKSR